MADSVGEAPTAAATQPELNLTDIKELLVDIQITVATILRENQELKQEILELKSALKVNQGETEKLKTPEGGGGGYFRNFWVGMCRWDPGTLSLYQS